MSHHFQGPFGLNILSPPNVMTLCTGVCGTPSNKARPIYVPSEKCKPLQQPPHFEKFTPLFLHILTKVISETKIARK